MKHGDLGSHSTRKGSITLVFSGCNVSPPISSICLRACWCMGNVKDGIYTMKNMGVSFVVEVSPVFHIYVKNMPYPQHILN